VRGASIRFEYSVERGDEPVAEGFTELAAVDREGRVARLPKEVAALLRPDKRGSIS